MTFPGKYMRDRKDRTYCWSTYGTQLFSIQSFTLLWMFLPLIALVDFFCWLADSNPVFICLSHTWRLYFRCQMPQVFQLGLLVVNFWTVLSFTFLGLCSITRMAFFLLIAAFWTRLGAKGESQFKKSQHSFF